MKPKPLSKRLTDELRAADKTGGVAIFNTREARAILAALEYERQRAEAALDHIVGHAKDFGGTPRGASMAAFLLTNGRGVMGEMCSRCQKHFCVAGSYVCEACSGGHAVTPEHQRCETEAVVPKRKRRPVSRRDISRGPDGE